MRLHPYFRLDCSIDPSPLDPGPPGRRPLTVHFNAFETIQEEAVRTTLSADGSV